MKHSGAKTKRVNKIKYLQTLNTRIRGSFKDFMTQEDLKIMREDAKWKGKRN
jgi:hypothetical protein